MICLGHARRSVLHWGKELSSTYCCPAMDQKGHVMSFQSLEIRESGLDDHLHQTMQEGLIWSRKPCLRIPGSHWCQVWERFQVVFQSSLNLQRTGPFLRGFPAFLISAPELEWPWWLLFLSQGAGRPGQLPEPGSGYPDHFGVGARCGQQLLQAHCVLIHPLGRRRIL